MSARVHDLRRERERLSARPPIVAGRPPPHDRDAERAVLSTALLVGTRKGTETDLLAVLIARLGTEGTKFYIEAHEWIWEAITDLHGRGEPIDLVTVAHRLELREKLAPSGGRAYLADIVDATPAVANAPHHAAIVDELAALRAWIATMQLWTAHAYGDVPEPRAFMAEGNAALEQASKRAVAPQGTSTMREAMIATRKELLERKRAASFGGPAGLSYGIPELEGIFGRLQPRTVTMLSAPTKGFKTTVATHMAVNIARLVEKVIDEQGKDQERRCGVGFFELEMSADELEFNASCQIGGVQREPFTHGIADEHAWMMREWGEREFEHMPLIVDARPDLSAKNLGARVRELRFRMQHECKAPLRVVFIDTLQIFAFGPEDDPKLQQALTDAAMRTVRILSTDADMANIAWIILSQENENGQIRGSRAPDNHCTGWIRMAVKEDDSQFARAEELYATFTVKLNRHGRASRGDNLLQASVPIDGGTGRVGEKGPAWQ